VLEWARQTWQGVDGYHGDWDEFVMHCPKRIYDGPGSYEQADVEYQIGDYARAALKVIE
jgi:hypothetical protein